MFGNFIKINELILKKIPKLLGKTALKTVIFVGLTAYWCVIIAGTLIKI